MFFALLQISKPRIFNMKESLGINHRNVQDNGIIYGRTLREIKIISTKLQQLKKKPNE